MKINPLDVRKLTQLFRELLKISGGKVAVSYLLQILTGFTQGISLLMLIPLLSIVGIFDHQGKTPQILEFLISFLKNIGVTKNLIPVLLFYIAVVSINAWLNKYQNIINAEIQQRFVRYLKDNLYTSIGHCEWLFASRLQMSDVAHVITSEVQRAGQVIFQVLRYTSSVITILIYLAVAFMLSATMALLALVGALLLFMIGQQKNKDISDIGKAGQRSAKKMYHVVLEYLNGMKIAKSFAGEDQYIRDFIYHSEEVEKRKIDYTRLSSRTSLMFSVGTVILLSVFVYIAIEVVHLPVAAILVLIYIFSRLLPKVSSLQSSYQSILQSIPAFTTVNQFQEQCISHCEALNREDDRPLKLKKTIEIRNLTFGYGAKLVFENLSLQIKINAVCCITGSSGSGKTTLADLLLGLLKPLEGSVLIDDEPLVASNLFRWRKSIGYVTQESFLFNDTIRNNLLWTKPDAADEELWDALERSSADEMVRQFEHGLDTLVGERGAQISGGERQRLALARALVRKPMLLILDEATNALDPVNENKIINALEKLKGSTTMLIISHNPEMQKLADQVIRVANRNIIHEQ